MAEVVLNPLQMNEFPDISDVHALDDSDQACLQELREVLRRHQRNGKFGIALLHKHFDLDADEILVERVDVEKRTLTAMPLKRPAINRANSVTTLWKFSDDADASDKECVKYCPTDTEGGHFGYKDHG